MPAFAFPFAGPFGGLTVGLPDPRPLPRYSPDSPAAADLGVDIECLSDLDPTFSLATGNRALAECLTRRLETSPGQLEYAPAFGKDIRAYLNATIDPATLNRLQGDIETELLRDERVKSASATVSYDPSALSMSISIQIGTAAGPFVLTLAVSALSVSLLRA